MIDLKLIGQKLKRCRENQEYSSIEVENGTGIAIKRLDDFENGLLEPSGDEILILSDFYKEDYKYFISNQQRSPSEKTDLLYRQFGGEFSKDDKRAIQAFMYLCESEQEIWNLLQIKNKIYLPPKLGNRIKEQASQGANDLRQFIGYQDNHLLDNLYDDLRKTGVHIFRFKLSNSNISGLFINHPFAGKCILVNYSEDLYRQNFTLVHEYAHAIFDTDKEFNLSFHKDNRDPKEVRANYFAANFLAPTNAIKKLNISQWNPEILIKVADQLQVNTITLLYRLKNMEMISENQLHILKKTKIPWSTKVDPEFKGLTQKGKLAKEALLKKGLTTNYVRNCHEVYMNGQITRNKLADLLLVNEFELPELLDYYNLKLVYEL